ncbi:hypothetical protein XENTR_v10008867 [Xenopus tropicalis]|nr:hypothetical protein XENTR_v10008867 [Xenopus tropicalis]
MVEEVVRQWDSLFGAQSCQLTAARRRDLWQQVADCVSAVSGVHRDHNTVYKRFSDLKRCIKKRFVAERARAQKAGVGPPTNILFKPYERRLLDRAGVEVFGGLRGEYMDSDRRRQAQRQRPTVQERQQTRQQSPPEAEDQPQDVSGADERDPGTPEHQAGPSRQSLSPPPVSPPRHAAANVAAAGGSGQEPGQGLERPSAEGSVRRPRASQVVVAALGPALGNQRSYFLSQRRLLARQIGEQAALRREVAALRVELETQRRERAAQHEERLRSEELSRNALLALLGHVLHAPASASAGSAEGSLPGPSFAPQPPPPSPPPRARGRGRGCRRGSDPDCGPLKKRK